GSAAPVETRARQSLSEPGWSRTSNTRATTTPFSRSHGLITASTLTPCAVRRAASSSGGRSVGQNSRSQDSRTFKRSPHRLELLEEAHVALEEQSDIGDAVFDHGDPLDAHPEREARVSLTVVSHVLQHVGMHHARA